MSKLMNIILGLALLALGILGITGWVPMLKNDQIYVTIGEMVLGGLALLVGTYAHSNQDNNQQRRDNAREKKEISGLRKEISEQRKDNYDQKKNENDQLRKDNNNQQKDMNKQQRKDNSA